MKFSVKQNHLLKAVQNVERVVPSQSTMPVLQGILVQCLEEDTIKLIGNDMEIGIECTIKGKISSTGSIVLPADFLSDISRELPQDEVVFTVDEDFSVEISCSKNILYNIKGMDPYQFPLLPEVEEALSFTLQQGEVKDQINKIKMAISTQDDVPVMGGALVELDGERMNMVATNSFRLAFKSIPLTEKKEMVEKKEIVIPGDALKELEKLLDQSGDMQISFTSRQAVFRFSNLMIISRIIEGDFPNYRMVIPDNRRLKVKAERVPLLRTIRRLALVSKRENTAIVVTFQGGKMRMNANDALLGTAQEEIPVEMNGEDLRIAFNPIFLLDVLRVLKDEDVFLELLDPLKPCVVKSIEDSDYIYLIMPIKISD